MKKIQKIYSRSIKFSLLKFLFLNLLNLNVYQASSAEIDFAQETKWEMNAGLLHRSANAANHGAFLQFTDANDTQWFIIVPPSIRSIIKVPRSVNEREELLTFLHAHPLRLTPKNTGDGKFFAHLTFANHSNYSPQDGTITNDSTVAYKLEVPPHLLLLTPANTSSIYLLRTVDTTHAQNYSDQPPLLSIESAHRDISSSYLEEAKALMLWSNRLATMLERAKQKNAELSTAMAQVQRRLQLKQISACVIGTVCGLALWRIIFAMFHTKE